MCIRDRLNRSVMTDTTRPKRYRMVSKYYKETYGEKVYKLPVALPLTCPNRDGSAGVDVYKRQARESLHYHTVKYSFHLLQDRIRDSLRHKPYG